MIVNLNTLCKIRLNEFGKVIWLSQIDSLSPEMKTAHPELVSAIQNKIDKEGCLELELWGIMSVFGQYMSKQNGPFASETIELSRNLNFTNLS